ncbi:MAG: bifunctional 3,4-dihydroxy-2-butanone-4-phosphate synthase/GTP cyclohydrolase II [Ottowia sp.]|nr:bifunctional 3,4-dihydroxy-2-butanone-4-phosphate synthase/GTP cyclohydrolase II [Ottowia sp.]
MNAAELLATPAAAAISPVPEIIAELRAGRMVILVDEEDRENEGDLILAADHVTPDAVNFMARYGRGLICLTLTRERCERLNLPQMAAHNSTRLGTAFTVSIEAAEGVSTGISAADRARTIQAAVATDARASDLVQPGHVFPLQAVDGGVLVRAGHTEAGCDLAAMAGCTPAAVICEIMNDDGSMARLPDLQRFAAGHGLKIGTIADLIEYRSRNETLVSKLATRPLQTTWGSFVAHTYRDQPSQSVHLALTLGQWSETDEVPVRVHEPLSILDLLDTQEDSHSWHVHDALRHVQQQGRGVVVLLNCNDGAEQLLAQFQGSHGTAAPQPQRLDLRSYGIGAQILRELGVRRMRLLGAARRTPSLAGGFGLEITGYVAKD